MDPPDFGGICTTAPASVQPKGRRTWTLDHCANLVMGKFVLRTAHARLFDGGLLPFGLRVGRAYPLSVIPVRAVWYEDPEGEHVSPEEGGLSSGERDVFEGCRFHVGRNVLLRGKRTVMFCSLRKGGALGHASTCLSFIYTGTLAHKSWERKLQRGKLYHLGAYETPAIYEAHLGSRKQYCGQPI